MSEPKGVFDGLKWTPVIATEGKVKPIPPVEDGDGTVFISIPSYRGRRIFYVGRRFRYYIGCTLSLRLCTEIQRRSLDIAVEDEWKGLE
jgi:hypothetical protein